MNSIFSLRPATPADAPLLRRWDRQPYIEASKGTDDWQWETELARTPAWREQWIAETEGHPLGFLQIIDPAREESGYWGAIANGFRAVDIWIGEKVELRKGYGTQMMRFALSRCFAEPEVTAVLVDPLARNTEAHRFYQRMGFRFVERRVFGNDNCFVYKLDRADWR